MLNGAARWQRLQDLVQAALDRPADSRDAFLREACGGDEDLRHEAASLVERDHRADGFLATPIGEVAAHAMTYSPGTSEEASELRSLAGLRMGGYEIGARIGAGGMGEVYRARDHALHRDVAIKVLPPAFATDPERLARFEREARLLASLNHPHIGAVYGLAGEANLRGIVLELIDGETLEARLARGPIPVAQALSLAQQIARALDHAHQHGVMHRDLKPANIMLTKSGAKLLDFGLAKWGAPRSGYSPSPSSASAGPDGEENVTSEGTILGTLHYMAPEQLEGKKVDARADVFAFGAVLYEMLTGRRAFDGGSAAAVMASVLNTEPAFETMKRLSSPGLERIVRKCLAKDPDNRWQTVRDLADELKWIAEQVERPEPVVIDRAARRTGLSRWATPSVAALALALMGFVGWRIGTATEPVAARPIVTFTQMAPVAGDNIGAFDISPDGTMLVYRSGRQLHLRRLDQLTSVPIPGTEGADEIAFSPDGDWVAFLALNQLKKVNVRTMAAPILLWEGEATVRSLNRSTVWFDDHTIVTALDHGQGLFRVPAEGGVAQPLTTFAETPPEFDHHSPLLLPGGRAMLFTVHDANAGFKVVAQSFSPEEQKVVGERKFVVEGFDPQYVPTGHLIFAKARSIVAVPFDAQRLEKTGPEVTLVEDAGVNRNDLNGGYRVSKSGTLVYRPRRSLDGRRLVLVDRTGKETAMSQLGAHVFGSPRISPNGKQMAYAQDEGTGGRRDIWTYEFASERITRVTEEGDNRAPIWTPDGQQLTYISTRDGPPTLFLQHAGGAPEQLVSGDANLSPGAWSRDGKVLIYMNGSSKADSDQLYSLAMDGDRKPTPLLPGPGVKRHASVSPDGRWIAYTWGRARTEVYVSNYPELTLQHQVSVEGGREPKWSKDGREIFYRSFRGVFAVPVSTTSGFLPGKPQLLFEADYVVSSRDFGLDYDLGPDGRFVMIKAGPDEQAPLGLHVRVNWVDELVRRVPTNQ